MRGGWKVRNLASDFSDGFLFLELFNILYDEKIDCWSLGVILYTLFKLEFPFGGDSLPDIYNQIKNFKFTT